MRPTSRSTTTVAVRPGLLASALCAGWPNTNPDFTPHIKGDDNGRAAGPAGWQQPRHVLQAGCGCARDVLQTTNKVAKVLAEEANVPVGTVHRWIREERGTIVRSYRGAGRAGGCESAHASA
jgi:hypothetical protein